MPAPGTYGDYIQNKMFEAATVPFYQRIFSRKAYKLMLMDKNLQKVIYGSFYFIITL
jgi:hypothetical protein